MVIFWCIRLNKMYYEINFTCFFLLFQCDLLMFPLVNTKHRQTENQASISQLQTNN